METKEKIKYKVIFDDGGKPWEKSFNSDDDLSEALHGFYNYNVNNDYGFNAIVFNSDGEDISESQFITEIIREITEK